MEPTTQRMMMSSIEPPRIQIGTVTWDGTTDSTVTVVSGSTSYTTTGASSTGGHVYSSTLPTIDSTGLNIDVELIDGYPSQVAWLGVCNKTTAFTYSSNIDNYTGWYWSGDIYYPPDTTDNTGSSTLTASMYRIALRTESSVIKFYIRKKGSVVRGPYPVPSGTLRLMMLAQGFLELAEANILNNGAIYQGGGGLF